MKATLINVGRGKVNKTIDVSVESPIADAEREVRKHLISSDTGLEPTNDPKTWNVFAGFHTVGQVTFNRDVAQDSL